MRATQPMHVVFVSPHSDPEAELGEPDSGGQCVYEHALAQSLSQIEGVHVHTFCRDSGKRPPISRFDNYTITRIATGENGFVPKEHLESHLSQFSQAVMKHVQDLPAVVLHGHYWDGGKTALQIAANRSINTPIVWTPHSLGSVKRKKFEGSTNERVYNFLPRILWENYTIYIADRVIVSTQAEKRSLMQDYSVIMNTVDVIAPGITPDHFSDLDQAQAREAFQLPQQGKMLLTLGRMSRSKGYHQALHVLHHLRSLGMRDAYLVVCGGAKTSTDPLEQRYLQELKQLARDLDCADQIHFLPAISHTRTPILYRAADGFLMTSAHEPFGLTVIEAMAAGIPVFAQNAGGPVDIIEHEETGWLVDFSRPDEVAATISRVLQDPRTTQVTTIAKAYIRREFSWTSKARKFARIYRTALAHPSGKIKTWKQQSHLLQTQLDLA